MNLWKDYTRKQKKDYARKRKARKQAKSRRQTLRSLKREAWKAFAEFIKYRDQYTCYTCGVKAQGSFLHAGHFIPATRIGTWLDERNVHAQCGRCNIWLKGNPGAYANRLVHDYGPAILEQLNAKSHFTIHYTREQLAEIAVTYRRRLQELKSAHQTLRLQARPVEVIP